MQTLLTVLGLARADSATHAPPAGADLDESCSPANAPFAVEPEVVRVTATELWDAYDANEGAAQVRFGQGPLLVSGAVERVTQEAGALVVQLSVSGTTFEVVRCRTTEVEGARAEGLRRGDLVMLLGARSCTHGGRVVVAECVLADADLTAGSRWERP